MSRLLAAAVTRPATPPLDPPSNRRRVDRGSTFDTHLRRAHADVVHEKKKAATPRGGEPAAAPDSATNATSRDAADTKTHDSAPSSPPAGDAASPARSAEGDPHVGEDAAAATGEFVVTPDAPQPPLGDAASDAADAADAAVSDEATPLVFLAAVPVRQLPTPADAATMHADAAVAPTAADAADASAPPRPALASESASNANTLTPSTGLAAVLRTPGSADAVSTDNVLVSDAVTPSAAPDEPPVDANQPERDAANRAAPDAKAINPQSLPRTSARPGEALPDEVAGRVGAGVASTAATIRHSIDYRSVDPRIEAISGGTDARPERPREPALGLHPALGVEVAAPSASEPEEQPQAAAVAPTNPRATPHSTAPHASVPAAAVHAESARAVPASANVTSAHADPTSRLASLAVPDDSPAVPLDKLADAVAARVSDRYWHVTLQLDPPELGRVRVDVSMRGEALHVRMQVADDTVQRAVEGRVPDLVAGLREHDFRVARVEITSRSTNSGGSSDPRDGGSASDTPRSYQQPPPFDDRPSRRDEAPRPMPAEPHAAPAWRVPPFDDARSAATQLRLNLVA